MMAKTAFFLPSPLSFAWLIPIQIVPMALACVFWSEASEGKDLLVIGLALATYAPLLLAPLVLRIFFERRQAPLGITWQTGLYYGLSTILGMVCGALWNLVTQGLLSNGLSLPSDILWGASRGAITAYFAMRLASYFHLARHKAQQAQGALDRLRVSHAAIIKAQGRQRQELIQTLEEGLEPSLEGVRRGLADIRSRLLQGEPPPDGRAFLDELEAMRERELRQLGRLLHPSIINVGLGAAVRSLMDHVAREVSGTVEMDARFREADDHIANRLSKSLRLCAYRAVEQGIDNALRHADATELRIELKLSPDDMLCISVMDNGKGVDASVTPGVGLSAMAGRVERQGGTWSLESGDSGGACLRVTLPLGV